MRIDIRSWVLAAIYIMCGLTGLVLIPTLRHTYAQFAAPLPAITMVVIRVGPEFWLLLAMGFAATIICIDLLFGKPWINWILLPPLVLLSLGLFLPLF